MARAGRLLKVESELEFIDSYVEKNDFDGINMLTKSYGIDCFDSYNTGSFKSSINAKYKIACLVLSGGGPGQKCPVPSGDRNFGKEIALSAGVGLFAGLAPARKGAKLDPIEALRHI